MSSLAWIYIILFFFVSCVTPETDSKLALEKNTPSLQQNRARLWNNIPMRSRQAMTGSQFISYTKNMSATAREKEILKQLRRGNIPDFLRYFRPITHTSQIRGKSVTITLWVAPDYLSLGSDKDFVRMPMNPITAQKLADQFGLMLPTKKIVDLIYQYSTLKLSPITMPPGPQMSSNDYIKTHQEKVEKALTSNQKRLAILAGHKKDVVISNRLKEKPKRVAIYGWHRGIGKAIQPLSIVHDQYYADYSHGIRLIAPTMLMNGQEVPVAEVLEDPGFASLLSDEGVIYPLRAKTE